MFIGRTMNVDIRETEVSLEREDRHYGYYLANWGYAQGFVD